MDDGAEPQDDLKREIRALQARLDSLEQEVSLLRAAKQNFDRENQGKDSAAETAKPAADSHGPAKPPNDPQGAAKPPGEHVPVEQKSWQNVDPGVVIKKSAPTKPAQEAKPLPPMPPPPPPPPRSSDAGVEQFVGRNLQKFGILFVVVGCACAILYSFQFFNAVMKITCGVIVSALMIGVGSWLDNKEVEGEKWYGRSLVGGGWALLYFTTYAAHHFESVRVIQEGLTDLLLLMVIAASAIARSLIFDSEVFTGFTLLLGLITISVSDVTGFSLLAVVLLASALMFLVVRKRWFGLFAYGMTLFYGIYFFGTLPQVKTTGDLSGFWLTFFCSLACWIIFNLTMFLLGFDEDEHHHRILAAATLINCGAFVLSISSQMPTELEKFRPALLGSLGITYAILAYMAHAKKLFMLRSANIYLALLLLTTALMSTLTGATLEMITLLEVPALVAFGLQYKLLPPRKFAVVLALYNLLAVWGYFFSRNGFAGGDPENILLGTTAIVCFAGSAALYKWPMLLQGAGVRNEDPFHFYMVMTALMLTVTTQENVPQNFLALAFAAEAVAFVHIGFFLKDRPLRVVGGLSVCVMSFVALLLTVGTWETVPTLLVVAILFYLGALYRGPEYHEVLWVGIMYRIAATLYLTVLLGQILSSGWLSIAWAFEGLVILFCGFQFKDKVMRIMGLSVLGLTIAKLLFVDLAFAETIYRILSFIVAGLVLIAASMGYLRLAKPPASPDQSSDAKTDSPQQPDKPAETAAPERPEGGST